MICATIIVGLGAGLAKTVVRESLREAQRDRWMVIAGLVVSLAIVGVGFRLFSSGYFIGY